MTTTARNSRTRTARTPREPLFTAETAQSFDSVSERSALQVIEAIAARKTADIHADCSCEPYGEVLTFDRWKALGQSVRKGEKALRIASYKPVKAKSEDADEKTGGDARPRLIPVTVCLFCKCQVDPTPDPKAGKK